MTTEPPRNQIAEAFEALAASRPVSRGEYLIEAAEHWRIVGNDDRAVVLLEQVIALGDEDGGHARVVMADLLFCQARGTEAEAQLDELRRSRPAPGPCHMAAELLEERGDLRGALTWFNMAVSRLSDQQLADRGFLSSADSIIGGRRRVRAALGIPPDSLDESMEFHDKQADEFIRALEPSPGIQLLFWPRPEIPHVHEVWPGMVDPAKADAVVAEREAANRKLAEDGHTKILMVPLSVARLREFTSQTGMDPLDLDTGRAFLAEFASGDGSVEWPPARNDPCWCGSDMKYKKCCGRPNISVVGPSSP